MKIAVAGVRAASRRALWTPPRVCAHAKQTRAFSASPPSRDVLPPIGAWEYFTRMFERRGTFVQNVESGVFSPDMSSLKRWLLFGVVQLPSETVVDLPEFLDGAKLAVASVLQATSSQDFTEFVVAMDSDREGKGATESPNAQLLQQWCTPICYEMMVDNVRHSWSKKRMFEVESVDVERVFLTMSRYDRVSEQELRDDAKLAQQVLMQRKWSSDATIERLQLNVGIVTTERTKQTLLDQNKVRVVDCKWYYQAALVSEVTTPDEIDWRVAAVVAERGLGQKILSESPLETTKEDESLESAKERESEDKMS